AKGIADDGYGDDARRAGPDPLDAAHGEKHREIAGHGRTDAPQYVDHEAEEQYRSAPEVIGKGSVNQLREAEKGDVRSYRKLPSVLVRYAEACPHLLQRRKDDVDRHGVQRHEE